MPVYQKGEVGGKRPPPIRKRSAGPACFSDDGKWIISKDQGTYTISVWDAAKEKVGKENKPHLQLEDGYGSDNLPIICGPLVLTEDGELRELATGKVKSVLDEQRGHWNFEVCAVKEGKEILALSRSYLHRQTGKPFREFPPEIEKQRPEERVVWLDKNFDKAYSASFFDPQSGKLLKSVPIELKGVMPREFAVSSDGRALIAWSSRGRADGVQMLSRSFRLFDLATGALRKTIEANDIVDLHRLHVMKNANRVLICASNQKGNHVSFLNLANGERTVATNAGFGNANVSNDEKKIVSIAGKKILIYSMGDWKEVHSFAVDDVLPHHVSFSPDDELILVTGARQWPAELNPFRRASPGDTVEDRVIQLYAAKTGKLIRTIAFPEF